MFAQKGRTTAVARTVATLFNQLRHAQMEWGSVLVVLTPCVANNNATRRNSANFHELGSVTVPARGLRHSGNGEKFASVRVLNLLRFDRQVFTSLVL